MSSLSWLIDWHPNSPFTAFVHLCLPFFNYLLTPSYPALFLFLLNEYFWYFLLLRIRIIYKNFFSTIESTKRLFDTWEKWKREKEGGKGMREKIPLGYRSQDDDMQNFWPKQQTYDVLLRGLRTLMSNYSILELQSYKSEHEICLNFLD